MELQSCACDQTSGQTKAKASAKGGVIRTGKKTKRNTAAMAEATKATRDKCKASMDKEGLKEVPEGTADAAAANN